MKAIIVSDDEPAITNISQILEFAGYDVIVYRWLLKALDNIEEISPHLIVISTKDYPRHWKTLAQFATNMPSNYKPKIILYANGGMSDEEKQKAGVLNIRGIFENINVEGLQELKDILAKEKDIYSGNLIDKDGNLKEIDFISQEEKADDEPQIAEENSENLLETENKNNGEKASDNYDEDDEIMSVSKLLETPVSVSMEENIKEAEVIFNNPRTNAMITGYTSNFDGISFSFLPDYPDYAADLKQGEKISHGSLKTDGRFYAVELAVKEVDGEKYILEIC